MVAYLLTALAGLVLGIAGMRAIQSREGDAPAPPAREADGEPQADASADQPASPPAAIRPRITPRHALIAAGVLTLAAIGVLAMRGDDGAASADPAGSIDVAAPAAAGAGGAKSLADVDTMIDRLVERLKANPTDGEGFRMLGWSYTMTGHPEKALEPYQQALKLLPKSALVHSGYGEALVAIAKDVVTPQAKAEFDQAIALDPQEPRARYFLALWQAQHGEERAALDKWIALANSGPVDAPWQADLRRKITEVSGKLGVDVSGRLKQNAASAALTPLGAAGSGSLPPALDAQTMQAGNALPEASRQAMVEQMVSGLAEKLKANPADAERWILLLRSRMVLKQAEQAKADLGTAQRALARDAAGLSRLNAAASELGVPGA